MSVRHVDTLKSFCVCSTIRSEFKVSAGCSLFQGTINFCRRLYAVNDNRIGLRAESEVCRRYRKYSFVVNFNNVMPIVCSRNLFESNLVSAFRSVNRNVAEIEFARFVGLALEDHSVRNHRVGVFANRERIFCRGINIADSYSGTLNADSDTVAGNRNNFNFGAACINNLTRVVVSNLQDTAFESQILSRRGNETIACRADREPCSNVVLTDGERRLFATESGDSSSARADIFTNRNCRMRNFNLNYFSVVSIRRQSITCVAVAGHGRIKFRRIGINRINEGSRRGSLRTNFDNTADRRRKVGECRRREEVSNGDIILLLAAAFSRGEERAVGSINQADSREYERAGFCVGRRDGEGIACVNRAD